MKRTFLLSAAIVLLLSSVKTYAQYTNILVSDVAEPNETAIFINPKNTDQIIAGANLNSCYSSTDGGLNWSRKTLISSLGVWGDPCVVVDTNGYFYFFHLSYPSQTTWLDQIVCQRTLDTGLTWSDGTGIGKNDAKEQDKEWACVNPMNNEIYVTWTQFDNYGSASPSDQSNILFSKSSDQGLSWSNAIQLNEIPGDCVDSDSTVEGAVPAVGPNGEIYVSWAGPEGLVFDRSSDGGQTWLQHDIFVSDIPGGWDYSVPGIYRANGLPITSCDISNSPYRGNIYINWTDERSNNGLNQDVDVWLVKSTDGGDTWCAPHRVNQDTPGKQQFFTWMAVDQVTGYLWFVFYDRRNYENSSTDVYMAVSKDGGETFEDFKISESPFIPNSNVFFGDYSGVSAHNNVVCPIWTRLDDHKLSAWTAIINPKAIKEETGIPFAIEYAYPNPFNESTVFSFKLLFPCKINLCVYDSYGNQVATLIEDSLFDQGKYIRNFEPVKYNLASGVYHFSLTGNGINKQQKIVYQK